MVLKPSERDPGASMILMELVNEAGFPPGTVNVVHGQHEGSIGVGTPFLLLLAVGSVTITTLSLTNTSA